MGLGVLGSAPTIGNPICLSRDPGGRRLLHQLAVSLQFPHQYCRGCGFTAKAGKAYSLGLAVLNPAKPSRTMVELVPVDPAQAQLRIAVIRANHRIVTSIGFAEKRRNP